MLSLMRTFGSMALILMGLVLCFPHVGNASGLGNAEKKTELRAEKECAQTSNCRSGSARAEDCEKLSPREFRCFGHFRAQYGTMGDGDGLPCGARFLWVRDSRTSPLVLKNKPRWLCG